MQLSDLEPGKCGIIKTVSGDGALRHHLLDMGLTPGTKVLVRKVAPLGDPLELNLRNYELTLRKDDAAMIEIDAQENLYSCKTCSKGSCPYSKAARGGEK
ncbi:MAG: ferrous iron transport protein A [Treponema sp.]|nr:ferrous iron transport protein A [Candidatus Treponema caballi]